MSDQQPTEQVEQDEHLKELDKAFKASPYNRDKFVEKLEDIKSRGWKISTWKKLCTLALEDTEKKKSKFDILCDLQLVDMEGVEEGIKDLVSHAISNPAENKTWMKLFDEEIRWLPKRMVYRIWEYIFLKAEMNKDELLLEDLSKAERTKIDLEKDVKSKYITLLTDVILSSYRNELVINDTFIYKLFEHNCDKILQLLLDSADFFNIQLEKGTLTDVYFVYACDMNNVKMLVKMMDKINIHHLEYSVRYGSVGWLSILYRYRRRIVNFDANMRMLDNVIRNKDWKMLKFFERWRRECKLVF